MGVKRPRRKKESHIEEVFTFEIPAPLLKELVECLYQRLQDNQAQASAVLHQRLYYEATDSAPTRPQSGWVQTTTYDLGECASRQEE
jgi:hypothetical protein